MLYVARKLHLSNVKTEPNRVVDVCGGVVKDIYPFSSESQSMILVDDIYLSVFQAGELSEIKTPSSLDKETRVYAYSLNEGGKLVILE